MFKPVPHQIEISDRAAVLLKERHIAYLSMEVRTYKTITSYMTCQKIDAKKVLLVSKKKAISSNTFQIDYDLLKPSFELIVINFESVHKASIEGVDTVIIDESHSCFVKNTLVGGVEISKINIGDLVLSYNENQSVYEEKEVVKVHKNKLTENLIKIKCNGEEIICTENHKILTRRGWVSAKNILPEDELQMVRKRA